MGELFDWIDRKAEELRESLPGFGTYGILFVSFAVLLHFCLCQWIFPPTSEEDAAKQLSEWRKEYGSSQLFHDSRIAPNIHARGMFFHQTTEGHGCDIPYREFGVL